MFAFNLGLEVTVLTLVYLGLTSHYLELGKGDFWAGAEVSSAFFARLWCRN